MTLHIKWFISKPVRASQKVAQWKGRRGFVPGVWDALTSLRRSQTVGKELILDTVGVIRCEPVGIELGAITLDDRLGDPSTILDGLRNHTGGNLFYLGGALGADVSELTTAKKARLIKFLDDSAFVKVRFPTTGPIGKWLVEFWHQLEVKKSLGRFHPMLPLSAKGSVMLPAARMILIDHIREMGYEGKIPDADKPWGQIINSLITSGIRRPNFKGSLKSPAAHIGRREANLKDWDQ